MSSDTPNEVDVWMDSIFTVCTIENGSWKIGKFDEKPVRNTGSPSIKRASESEPVEVSEPLKKTPEEIAKGLLGLARLYAANKLNPNAKDKAKDLLESIIKDYPQTTAAKEAREELKNLNF